MTTAYPNAIDGYSNISVLTDGVSEIVVKDHNDVRSAILAIEQTLGISPQGAFGTVVARLSSYGSNIGTNASNFSDHTDGTGFRHDDTHIDTNIKASAFNGLFGTNVQEQTQELLVLSDYLGSGITLFADGTDLPAQSLVTTPTGIVEQLGGTDGYSKVGASAVAGSTHNLPSGAVSDHTGELLSIVNAIASFAGGTLVGIDSALWTRINGPPAPSDAQEALDRIDAYVDGVYDEVEMARISPIFSPTGGIGGGEFPNIDSRMDVNDTHVRTIISCTDGVVTAGGIFDGTDALQNALTVVASGAADDYGALILLRSGSYNIDANMTISNTVIIMGVENDVIVTNDVGAGYMFIFDAGSDGSAIRNLQMSAGAGSSHQMIQSITDRNIFTNLFLDGEIRIDGYFNKVQECDFYGSLSATTLINVTSSSTDFIMSHCDVDSANSPTTMMTFAGDRSTITNCTITSADTNSALEVTGDGLVIRDSVFLCAPFTVATPVIEITGDDVKIDGLEMINNGSGDIRTNFIYIIGSRFLVENMKVDMGSGRLRFSIDNSPLAFTSDNGIIDNLFLRGGIIPTGTTDGFTLEHEFPLIRLTGAYALDDSYGVITMQNSYIKCPEENSPVGTMELTIIGDEGDASFAALNRTGFFKLNNITIDGYNTQFQPAAESKFMICNIPEKSVINNCKFMDGSWSCCIRSTDSNDTQIINNDFRFELPDAVGNIVKMTSVGAIDRVAVNNNHMVFNHLENVTNDGYAVLIWGGGGGSFHSVNDNIMWNDNIGVAGNGFIHFGQLAASVAMGNTISLGNGSNTGIFPITQAAGNLYQDGTGAGLNIIL